MRPRDDFGVCFGSASYRDILAMFLSQDDIDRFDKLVLQNTEAVMSALGAALILNWKDVPTDLKSILLRSADLIEPIRKHSLVSDANLKRENQP